MLILTTIVLLKQRLQRKTNLSKRQKVKTPSQRNLEKKVLSTMRKETRPMKVDQTNQAKKTMLTERKGAE